MADNKENNWTKGKVFFHNLFLERKVEMKPHPWLVIPTSVLLLDADAMVRQSLLPPQPPAATSWPPQKFPRANCRNTLASHSGIATAEVNI